MALEITDGNITEVLGRNELVVLQFSADWCGPCRMLSPIIEGLSEVNTDVTIGKLNVDNNGDTAKKYGIRSIPTVLFLKNGEVIDKMVGISTKEVFQEKINSLK